MFKMVYCITQLMGWVKMSQMWCSERGGADLCMSGAAGYILTLGSQISLKKLGEWIVMIWETWYTLLAGRICAFSNLLWLFWEKERSRHRIFRFRCPRCCGCRAWLWSGEKFVTKNHGRHSWWAATSASHLGSRHQLQWTRHLIS